MRTLEGRFYRVISLLRSVPLPKFNRFQMPPQISRNSPSLSWQSSYTLRSLCSSSTEFTTASCQCSRRIFLYLSTKKNRPIVLALQEALPRSSLPNEDCLIGFQNSVKNQMELFLNSCLVITGELGPKMCSVGLTPS